MELRNRLVMATQMWREATTEAAAAHAAGRPAEQLAAFELKLIDMLCAQATPQTARDVADKTWDLVHDRADDDPVKRRVVECHEALARLSARGGGSGFLGFPVRELPELFDVRVKARSIAYLFAAGARSACSRSSSRTRTRSATSRS